MGGGGDRKGNGSNVALILSSQKLKITVKKAKNPTKQTPLTHNKTSYVTFIFHYFCVKISFPSWKFQACKKKPNTNPACVAEERCANHTGR